LGIGVDGVPLKVQQTNIVCLALHANFSNGGINSECQQKFARTIKCG